MVKTQVEHAEKVQGGRLGELYVRHADDAVRLAYLLTGDRALAEDLVQDAFVRLAGRLVHLRDPDAFDAYLRRTVVNLSNSYFRRKKVERAYLERATGGRRVRGGPGPPVEPAPRLGGDADAVGRADHAVAEPAAGSGHCLHVLATECRGGAAGGGRLPRRLHRLHKHVVGDMHAPREADDHAHGAWPGRHVGRYVHEIAAPVGDQPAAEAGRVAGRDAEGRRYRLDPDPLVELVSAGAGRARVAGRHPRRWMGRRDRDGHRRSAAVQRSRTALDDRGRPVRTVELRAVA